MSELSKEDIDKIKNELPILIGQKIKYRREQLRLTQSELAFRIISDRQYLYKIEHGKVSVSLIKLAIIAKALKIDLGSLFNLNLPD
ncbi:MAG: helix-turn-helix transcriptional regulator [Flavobacteriales bacterium]|nr:helix-turn-helix transcriptional regulator [Flavobacteriales bacterium]